MKRDSSIAWRVAAAAALVLVGCGGGGGGGSDDRPAITIENPTSAARYSTNSTDVRLGGTIARAGFVHVRNAATGFTADGYVNYYDGKGTWFADVQGLGLGDNPIVVTADADGTGAMTMTAFITVARPEEPASLIINGANVATAGTFWTDASSYGGSHWIALFADGTGRSTTGSTLTEPAGAVVGFSWTLVLPDAVRVSDCPDCSFQRIGRIAGSVSDGSFVGEVVTKGELVGSSQLHAFVLTAGTP
jgi:hypothetical protein